MLLRLIVDDSERRKTSLLIGCISNDHQQGSTGTNKRGESIFDFILSIRAALNG